MTFGHLKRYQGFNESALAIALLQVVKLTIIILCNKPTLYIIVQVGGRRG